MAELRRSIAGQKEHRRYLDLTEHGLHRKIAELDAHIRHLRATKVAKEYLNQETGVRISEVKRGLYMENLGHVREAMARTDKKIILSELELEDLEAPNLASLIMEARDE